jgi:hypothetical protein
MPVSFSNRQLAFEFVSSGSPLPESTSPWERRELVSAALPPARKAVSKPSPLRGTEGSNPAPSSDESSANLTSGHAGIVADIAIAGMDRFATPVGLRPPFIAHPATLPHPDRRALLTLIAAAQKLRQHIQ